MTRLPFFDFVCKCKEHEENETFSFHFQQTKVGDESKIRSEFKSPEAIARNFIPICYCDGIAINFGEESYAMCDKRIEQRMAARETERKKPWYCSAE